MGEGVGAEVGFGVGAVVGEGVGAFVGEGVGAASAICWRTKAVLFDSSCIMANATVLLLLARVANVICSPADAKNAGSNWQTMVASMAL